MKLGLWDLNLSHDKAPDVTTRIPPRLSRPNMECGGKAERRPRFGVALAASVSPRLSPKQLKKSKAPSRFVCRRTAYYRRSDRSYPEIEDAHIAAPGMGPERASSAMRPYRPLNLPPTVFS